jgi:hypothetical protein
MDYFKCKDRWASKKLELFMKVESMWVLVLGKCEGTL